MSDRMSGYVGTNLRAFANDSCRCIRNFLIFWWDPNALSTIKWCISQGQQLCIPEQTLRFTRLDLFYILMNHWMPHTSKTYPNLKKSAAFPHASLSQRAILNFGYSNEVETSFISFITRLFLSLRYLSMKILSKKDFLVWKKRHDKGWHMHMAALSRPLRFILRIFLTHFRWH